ncbi:MAG: YHS domain-containing protein [Acidobacteriota bacterium]
MYHCLLALGLLIGTLLIMPGATFAVAPQTEPPLAATAPSGKPICPVMLDEVEDLSEAAYSDYRGKRYYFCCPVCKSKFDKNPRRYIRALKAKQRKMATTQSS